MLQILRATDHGRGRLVVLALLTILGAIFEFAMLAALIALLRSWLGRADFAVSGSAVALFVGVVLATGAIRFALLSVTQQLAFDMNHRLIVAVQRRVLARDWLTHAAARSSGPLLALQLAEDWLYWAFLPLLQAGAAAVLAVGILAGLLWFDAPAALAAAGSLTLLFLLANGLVRSRLRKAGATFGTGYEDRIAAVQDHVGAMRELILAGARGLAAERFRLLDRKLADARISMQVAQGFPRIMVESVGIAALALVAWWLAGRQGGLTAAIPTLAALGLGAQRLLPLLQTMSQAVNALAASGAIQQRMAEMLAEPDLSDEALPPPLPFTQSIGLDHVSFRYPGRDDPALSEVSLTISRGERIALIGPNGSGKSTLADLLMGLLRPGSGRMMVDGRELTAGQVTAWQRNVAHVPQTPFVADTSLTQAIAFMDATPDLERVAQAARMAGLDKVVASLPHGLNTRVGERGQLLSGGQRQRVALARALYDPAPFLVLDEATSALDTESEAHVLRALDALQAGGTTIVIIAHRETMLKGCDRVFRLDHGRLVEA